MNNNQPLDLVALGETLPPGIFNVNKTDYEKPELFLGQPGGLISTLYPAYPELMTKYEELKAMDWKHIEFDYQACQGDFATVRPGHSRKMIRMLAWQWEGDSTASRAISSIILPLCTSAESTAYYTRLADSENLHALTYSEITRGSFADPNVILEEIARVRESHGRLATVGRIFEKARLASLEWQTTGIRTKAIEQAVVLFVCAMYALERGQFMISFSGTFAVCETTHAFEPIASAVQLILRDEYNNHVPAGEVVFKYLMETQWGQEAFIAIREELIGAVVEITHSELAWVDYIHHDDEPGDELPMATQDGMKQYGLFSNRAVCVAFGILDEVEALLGMSMPEKNPLQFMERWVDINANQSSPQEQDNNQYQFNLISLNNITDDPIDIGIDFSFGGQYNAFAPALPVKP